MLGGPAQKMPKFQMGCMGQVIYQSCFTYSPDGLPKVFLKKIDHFMHNQHLIVRGWFVD